VTPEEAGERAAAEAEAWVQEVTSREPVPGTMEDREWGPPGRWAVRMSLLAPIMKQGHKSKWVIVGPKTLGGGNEYLRPEEVSRAVREQVEVAARFAIPLLKWMSRIGFDPRDLSDEVTVREVMES